MTARWSGVALLLILWVTRLSALELLPLHNDEGLHLTRAVEVWNGHPFWAISDGKIINHWLIAAFYPQHAPVFAGRIATIFVSLIGLAAGYALAKRVSGTLAAVLSAALWLGSPYLFFYERLAFSDAQAGALVMLALWFVYRFTHSGKGMDALLMGLAFSAAALFKFTAAPYAISLVLLLIFLGKIPLRQRFTGLILLPVAIALCFVIPLLYLMLRGQDFFEIALGWIGASSGGQPSLIGNVERLWSQFTGFGTLTGFILLLAGFGLLILARRRQAGLLLLAGLLPLLIILILGREVLSRHFIVTLPVLLTLAGAGLGLGLERIRDQRSRYMAAGLGVLALFFGITPFALTAYSNPAELPLPADARYEHVTSHSSGYGLREAVQSFSTTIPRRDVPIIIGSMFPDSCRRANFYALDGLTMTCVGAPGITEIQAALQGGNPVYVLVDNAPIIGVDVTQLGVSAERVAGYPRPGETEANASVVLWRLQGEGVTADTDCPDQTLAPYTPSVFDTFITLHEGRFYEGDTVYTPRGLNYYPARYPWRRFLTQADLEIVNNELALLRATGFNSLRIFLWNEALFICPNSHAIPNPDTFARLDAIIQSAAGQGFRLIVTLNDLPDLTVTPLYTNPAHLQEQTRFIIERYRDEPAILAWDLRNEGDIDYGSNAALSFGAKFAPEQVLEWLRQTSTFIRDLDSNHLITAGWLHDSPSTAPYVDFISFHHWDDASRLRECIADIRAETDKPILLEEFGFSTFRVSPEEQARLITEVAQTAEAENLLGWLIWSAFDFPLGATCIEPACPSLDNAEHHFGLWYADYTPKPVIELLLK